MTKKIKPVKKADLVCDVCGEHVKGKMKVYVNEGSSKRRIRCPEHFGRKKHK